jgi:hypothetical protein
MEASLLNKSISEWVSAGLRSFKPSRAIAIRALRHFSQKRRADLFSKRQVTKQRALGQLYEAVIYERLVELSKQNTDCSVVMKGADVRWNYRTRSKLGQDGLFYDENGSIVARGNGQDLAEFDFLAKNFKSEMAYAEVKTSGANLKEFDLAVAYKRRLLEFLFSTAIQFVLLSCTEIGSQPVVKRIMNTPCSFLVVTAPLDELEAALKQGDVSDSDLSSNDMNRSTMLSDLKVNRIHYLRVHNYCLKELINSAINRRKPDFKGNSWMIKRIIIGYLDEISKRKLFDMKNIITEKERLSADDSHGFPRAVLALRMPTLRPEIYLKLPEKRVYLKMGPSDTSTFTFERNIRSRRTAFFDWLEKTSEEVKPELMETIMKEYLKDDVVGSRRKPYEMPES